MQVCKFLEVSRYSFLQEYGPKLKEGYVKARHLPKVQELDDGKSCCACHWFSCCNGSWKKVFVNRFAVPWHTARYERYVSVRQETSLGNIYRSIGMSHRTMCRYIGIYHIDGRLVYWYGPGRRTMFVILLSIPNNSLSDLQYFSSNFFDCYIMFFQCYLPDDYFKKKLIL